MIQDSLFMFRIFKKSLYIVPLLIAAVCLPLFVGCSTGIDDLHTNRGPGIYEQVYDITVSRPSVITFTFETTRHEFVVINDERTHVSQKVVFDAMGNNRYRIASQRSETGLKVTVKVAPKHTGYALIETFAQGFLNGNKIHEHRDRANIDIHDPDYARVTVMGLGDFAP